jgi:biopolymer transport protein ExbD
MQFTPKRQRRPTIIIIALIDVLCILLIFQMVTMTFRDSAAVELQLPESSQASENTAKERVHTPRFCGLACSAGLAVFFFICLRPLRTS